MKTKRLNLLPLFLFCVILFTACNQNETLPSPSPEGNSTELKESDTTTSVSSDDAEPVNVSDDIASFPAADYDSWLTDKDGNKLWGYYAPIGFIKNDDYSSERIAYYARDGKSVSGINIIYSPDDDERWKNWYETDIPNESLYNNDSEDIFVTASANGTIETPYGIFKDYLLIDERRNYPNSEIAFLSLPGGGCIEVRFGVSKQEYAPFDYRGSMEYLLKILTYEKSEPVAISDSYENYLVDATGEKIWGCNTLPDVSVDNSPLDLTSLGNIIHMKNNQYTVSIRENHQLLPIYELNESELAIGEDPYSNIFYAEFTYKEEIETIYGTAKLYEEHDSDTGATLETAIFKINGRYIYVSYSASNASYHGALRNIIETQLF